MTALVIVHQVLAVTVPNPPPSEPAPLAGPVNIIIGWGKWGVIVCGVVGLLIAAGKMTIGHKNRATMAADGATSIPWVLGGLSLAVASAGVVAMFIK